MQRLRDNDHVAVLLLAFGGPNTLSEIEPFLQNIFCSRPVPPALVEEVRKRYKIIGGASPLTDITRAQARALRSSLQRKGIEIDVHYAMRHWHPFIPDVLTELEIKGVRRLLYLVMSPYCTPASTGGYDKAVRIWEDSAVRRLITVPVTGWHDHPRYLDALIETIRQGLEAFPARSRTHVPLLFTAHSLPEAQVRDDPYVERLRATVQTIVERLKSVNYHLAFQSRGRRREAWLQPGPEEILENLAQSGIDEVLVVPIGFVADHLETLYDLDSDLKSKACAMGVHFERSPSLNDNPLFIDALTETVLDSLKHSLS